MNIGNQNHGYPFEVVIPCATEQEAIDELTDLHVAAEARSFIRRTAPDVTGT